MVVAIFKRKMCLHVAMKSLGKNNVNIDILSKAE